MADLNIESSPEVYVYVRTTGGSNIGSLVSHAANKKKSLSQMVLPDLAEENNDNVGYRGGRSTVFGKQNCPHFDSRVGFVMTLTAVLTPDPEGGYVAHNPETGTTTQGDSVCEALSNLKEATELFLEEFPLEVVSPLMTTFEVSRDPLENALSPMRLSGVM